MPKAKSYFVDGIKVPKKVFQCVDCKTISDYETSNTYHVGHLGVCSTPILPLFAEKKIPEILPNGEIIWVNKES